LNQNDILCIIPARGGSKGIAGKNLMLIHGMPLVEHSITHALDAGLKPDQVVVSSDSDDILDIARRNDVWALRRPDEISGDDSSTEEALLNALIHHNGEHILLLQVTSPIRFKGTLNRFIDFYLDGSYDSALTTTKFYDFFWREAENGIDYESTYDPENRPMRQSLQPYDYVHFDNGNMYLTNRKVLETKKCRIGDSVGLFPITELEGMQIDTPEDLEIFRAVFSGKIAEKIGLECYS